MNALMSVVVKFYNQKRYVERCLKSVFAQTYSPLEIVVMDDCSTDGSYELAKELAETYAREDGRHQVSVFRNERNLERATTLAHGISHSHGELVFQVDGDDMCLPNRVELVVNEWSKTDEKADAVWSECYEINERDRIIGLRSNDWEDIPCPFGAVMAYRRSCLENVLSLFDDDRLRSCFDDWTCAMLALINGNGSVLKIHRPLLLYRLGGISSGLGGIRASKLASAKRTMNSILFIEDALRTSSLLKSADPSVVKRIVDFMAYRKKIIEYVIKRYSGKTMAERYDGLVNHPFGRSGAICLKFWLVELPLLLFPGKISDWTIALHENLHALKSRFKYRAWCKNMAREEE